MTIRSDRFTRAPGGLSFRPTENFSYLDLWNLISSRSQSNAVLGIDDRLALQIYYVEMPAGAGRARPKQAISIGDIRKRSIVTIQNKDTLCLPRALVVAGAHLAFKTNKCDATRKEWRVISNGRRKLQKERAEKLVAEAGIILPLQGCGFRELTVFQDFFLLRRVLPSLYLKSVTWVAVNLRFLTGEQSS